MKILWCDTETTGLEPDTGGAFQIAFVYRWGNDPKKNVWERVFYLNPLDAKYGIEYSESAVQVHGVKRETIENYDPASIVMPKVAEFLSLFCHGFCEDGEFEKLFFAGYNCKPFDWGHIDALLARYTQFHMTDFFNEKPIDVMEQVKRAIAMGFNPVNKKLTTVCKSLGVSLENAHDALGDIKATRICAVALQRRYNVSLIV